MDTFSRLQTTLFFGVLAVGLGFFVYTVSLFLLPFFWATVASIVLFPLYTAIKHQLHNETVSALLTIVIVCCVAILPLSIIGTLVADEAVTVYYTVSTKPALEAQAAPVLSLLERVGVNKEEALAYMSEYATAGAKWIAQNALSVGKATLMSIVSLIVTLYLLFFFLRDGKRILRFIQFHIPLGDEREYHLFTTFTSITRALFKGTLVVAIAQSIVCGALFWVTGLPHVFLLMAITLIAACIPGIGPVLVWGPASVWLFAHGDIVGGSIVVVVGALVVGLIDNMLRPILVGRETALPDPIILISILGGIASFGIPGLIIGPVSAGLALALLKMFREEYGEALQMKG